MRKKEQQLWDRMRNNLRGMVRLERIENMVGNGRPDVDTLRQGRVTPFELKCVLALPKRATTRVLGDDGLNVDQRNWHRDWGQWGGRSVILIGVKDTGYHWALWGQQHGDHVNDMTQLELSRYSFAMGVRHGDGFWTRLLEQL